jgi:hypothetical protein
MMGSPFEERVLIKSQNTGERVDSVFETSASVGVEKMRRSRKESTQVVEGLESYMTRRHRFGGAGIMWHVAVGFAQRNV